jgi:hypothetical protein
MPVRRRGARHEDQDQGEGRFSSSVRVIRHATTHLLHAGASAGKELDMKIKTKVKAGSVRQCA